MSSGFAMFSPEHEAFRQTVKQIVAKEMRPFASKWDEAEEFPLELYKSCAKHGFFGLKYPEEYGGTNAGFIYEAEVVAQDGSATRAWSGSFRAGTVRAIDMSEFCGADSVEDLHAETVKEAGVGLRWECFRCGNAQPHRGKRLLRQVRRVESRCERWDAEEKGRLVLCHHVRDERWRRRAGRNEDRRRAHGEGERDGVPEPVGMECGAD